VNAAWTAEAGAEARLGEETTGLRAATEAGAEAQLGEATQAANSQAATAAAARDVEGVADLVRAEEQALEESHQPGSTTPGDETAKIDRASALDEQASAEGAALEVAEQPTLPGPPGTPAGAPGSEPVPLTTGRLTPRAGSGAEVIVTKSVQEISWISRATAYFRNFSAIQELKSQGSITVAAAEGGLTPALRDSVFQQMAEITRATGKEVALLQTTDGTVIMRMGDAAQVTFDLNDVQSIIGHTHPSGQLGLSYDLHEIAPGRFRTAGDVPILQRLGQQSTWVGGPDGTFRLFNVSDWQP
jgi:hypothetical protein